MGSLGGGGWNALPYLMVIGNVPRIDPLFLTFSDPLVPFFMIKSILLTPFSAEKNQFVSITFSPTDNLT